MKYKVREGYFLHLKHADKPTEVLEGGAIVDLNADQADLHACQIEAVEEETKQKSKKEKQD